MNEKLSVLPWEQGRSVSLDQDLGMVVGEGQEFIQIILNICYGLDFDVKDFYKILIINNDYEMNPRAHSLVLGISLVRVYQSFKKIMTLLCNSLWGWQSLASRERG